MSLTVRKSLNMRRRGKGGDFTFDLRYLHYCWIWKFKIFSMIDIEAERYFCYWNLCILKAASIRTVFEKCIQGNCPGEPTFLMHSPPYKMSYNAIILYQLIQVPSSPINSSSCLASPRGQPASPSFGINHQASPNLTRWRQLKDSWPRINVDQDVQM